MSKKLRFEVFKRDKFTCQYCGAKAPDVGLHADHIKPVATGGKTELINLLTSCASCNGGKGARPLSDSQEVDRQRAQIEELQERREQIEMMLDWREELAGFKNEVLDIVCERISVRGPGLSPNENGKNHIRRWLKRFSLEEILAGIEDSFDTYAVYDGDKITKDSWETAFGKVPGVISMNRQRKEKPYLVRLFYIQGILRNRFRNRYLKCVDALESFVLDGLSVDRLETLAKRSDDWDWFWKIAEAALQEVFAEEIAQIERENNEGDP